MSAPTGGANGTAEEGSEWSSEGDAPPPLRQRVADAVRGVAAATAAGVASLGTAARDGTESLRDGYKKAVVRMDKWADAGAVSIFFFATPAAAPLCGAHEMSVAAAAAAARTKRCSAVPSASER